MKGNTGQVGGRQFHFGSDEYAVGDDLRLVDPILTNLAVNWRGNNHIWRELFPEVPVPKNAFKYPIFGKESFADTRLIAARADSDEAQQLKRGATTETGEVVHRWIAAKIDEVEEEEASAELDRLVSDQANAEFLADLADQWKELDCADLAFNAANYASGQKYDASTVNTWDHADGDPIGDITDALESNKIPPNVMVMSRDVLWANLKNAKYRSTTENTTIIDMDRLMKFWQSFGIEKILVGQALVFDPTDSSLSYGWSDGYCLLANVPNVPNGSMQNMERPAYGYTFSRKNYPKVATINKEENAYRYQRIWTASKPYIVGSDAGFLFFNCTA